MKANKYYILVILICAGIIALVIFISRSKEDAYLTRGKESYEKHCANCHGKNGEGLQLLIPPLTDASWVNNDSIICIIKNGMEGQIRVNQQPYNSRMPGNAKIENDDIADLVSYIRHEFTHQPQKITLKEVTTKILNCK